MLLHFVHCSNLYCQCQLLLLYNTHGVTMPSHMPLTFVLTTAHLP